MDVLFIVAMFFWLGKPRKRWGKHIDLMFPGSNFLPMSFLAQNPRSEDSEAIVKLILRLLNF